MGDFVVRLSSLTLQNIKNVKNGTIFMPMANEKSLSVSGAETWHLWTEWFGENGRCRCVIFSSADNDWSDY